MHIGKKRRVLIKYLHTLGPLQVYVLNFFTDYIRRIQLSSTYNLFKKNKLIGMFVWGSPASGSTTGKLYSVISNNKYRQTGGIVLEYSFVYNELSLNFNLTCPL